MANILPCHKVVVRSWPVEIWCDNTNFIQAQHDYVHVQLPTFSGSDVKHGTFYGEEYGFALL